MSISENLIIYSRFFPYLRDNEKKKTNIELALTPGKKVRKK
jgi:hypothetical protein